MGATHESDGRRQSQSRIENHSEAIGSRYKVGQCGTRVWIAAEARVLDVGAGHAPHPRANVLLDKYPDENSERSGAGMDTADPRLVVGDAAAMPFRTGEFDYAIASHVAEHVEDPATFCSELSRVADAGYIETPGWLGDRLLREPYHSWRVRRRGNVLEFTWVRGDLGFRLMSELAYAVVYLGEERPGHRTVIARRRLARLFARVWRYGIAALLRLPVIVDAMYTRHEWRDEVLYNVQRA